jgi:hypothetical protein
MKHAFRRLPSVRSTEHSHRHRRRPLQAMNRRAEASVPVRQIISFLHGGSSDTLAADVEIEPPHASASMSGSTTTSTSAPLRARARAIDSEQKQIKGDRSAARLPRPAALRSGRPDSSKRNERHAVRARRRTRRARVAIGSTRSSGATFRAAVGRRRARRWPASICRPGDPRERWQLASLGDWA